MRLLRLASYQSEIRLSQLLYLVRGLSEFIKQFLNVLGLCVGISVSVCVSLRVAAQSHTHARVGRHHAARHHRRMAHSHHRVAHSHHRRMTHTHHRRVTHAHHRRYHAHVTSHHAGMPHTHTHPHAGRRLHNNGWRGHWLLKRHTHSAHSAHVTHAITMMAHPCTSHPLECPHLVSVVVLAHVLFPESPLPCLLLVLPGEHLGLDSLVVSHPWVVVDARVVVVRSFLSKHAENLRFSLCTGLSQCIRCVCKLRLIDPNSLCNFKANNTGHKSFFVE